MVVTNPVLVWCAALSSVLALSLVSLIGILTISVREERLQSAIFVMVSLAVGAMFGDGFLHLLPEVFASEGPSLRASIYMLAGLLAFFLLEKFLLWRHEHLPQHAHGIHPVGYMNIAADALHNFIDGLLIGASYLVSMQVGLGTTLAVLLHEIPQEIGDFGIMLHAGFSRRKALLVNFGTATLAFLGVVVAMLAGARMADFPSIVLPLAAGGFLYIAGSDLVPELHKERNPSKSAIQFLAIGIGVSLMLLLRVLG
jgi:zinc and cadmium transporter